MTTFLSRAEVDELTDIRRGSRGRPKFAAQIAQLRKMGIAFHVSAIGRPVVARAAIEGKGDPAPKPASWQPTVLSGGRHA